MATASTELEAMEERVADWSRRRETSTELLDDCRRKLEHLESLNKELLVVNEAQRNGHMLTPDQQTAFDEFAG